jgi:hypothetical protein
MTNKRSMGWENKRYTRSTNLFVLLRRTAVTLVSALSQMG